jgi:hypothetical protein
LNSRRNSCGVRPEKPWCEPYIERKGATDVTSRGAIHRRELRNEFVSFC